MNDKVHFSLRGRNPDVLTCIANLSNDEVFTPPELANRMLNNLATVWADQNEGANIWADSSVKFLDPCTKSGVFLREITSRLTKGLADEIPILEERVDHILTKQVFGIGITYLTSLLARRSVYCSKHATGIHSIGKSFNHEQGNIWYERIEHQWIDSTEWAYVLDQHGKKSVNSQTGNVNSVVLRVPCLIETLVWKTTPMRSYTQKISMLAFQNYLEVVCNLT